MPRDAVDAWRFERLLDEAGDGAPEQRAARLTEALALWRGPALADYVGEAAPQASRSASTSSMPVRVAVAVLLIGSSSVGGPTVAPTP